MSFTFRANRIMHINSHNAQLTARSNVGDFAACFCRKGANITESGGAAGYVSIFSLVKSSEKLDAHFFQTAELLLVNSRYITEGFSLP